MTDAAQEASAPKAVLRDVRKCVAAQTEDSMASLSCVNAATWLEARAHSLQTAGKVDSARKMAQANVAAMTKACELGMTMACTMLEQ